MRKEIQRLLSVLAVCAASVMILMVGGAQNVEALPDDVETASADEEKIPDNVEAASTEETIPAKPEEELIQEGVHIDFPFPFTWDDVYEDAVLILVCVDESVGTYELHLYDKDGNIVQKLSCGELAEPIRFSYDDLSSDGREDLEIFSDGSQSGLLFITDYAAMDEGKLFRDEAMEIPIYDEDIRNGFLVFDENEAYLTETLYQINNEKKSSVAFRRLTLQKEDATLEIWDYLDNRSIYKGEVALREDGSLANEEYYQYLFRGNLYYLGRTYEDDTIPVWVSETDRETETTGEQNGFEWAQETVFGNTGHMEEYENRRTFLTDFGFADKEPFYKYYDGSGNLQLELYLDEVSGRGCGLMYGYHYTYQLEKQEAAYGFAFDAVYQGKWETADPYILTTVEGYTGENDGREYEEIIEYTEDGKIDYYKSMAFVDWIGGEEEKEEKDSLLEINYIYRDDGTMYYRDYSHNSMVFSTTSCSRDSYYDELERVVYESSYITHGSYEEYYIYDDNGEEPAYYLSLDDNLGYCIPTLVRFH